MLLKISICSVEIIQSDVLHLLSAAKVALPAVLVVVGGMFVGNKLSGTVRVQVAAHVVALGLHVGTHLVEGRGRDHVALAVDLPGNGSVRGADLVVSLVSGSGTGVLGNVLSHLAVDNHAAEEVGVVVALVVHNGKDLSLDANLSRGTGQKVGVAKDTIVERGLVLVGSSTSAESRVRPVNFVGLSDLHVDAVLPLVGLGELGVLLVVVLALETHTARFQGAFVGVGTTEIRVDAVVDRSDTSLVVLSDGQVLGT